jgi:hypothetical protein
MKIYAPLLIVLNLFAVSCNKGGDDPQPIGGKGGNATIKVTPRHHGQQIDSCMIYVKYNAVDAPANNVYDDSAKCILINGVPIATFAGLKNGNYYFWGYGWDPQLSPPKAVKGGYAYPVQEETLQSFDLAVSED